METAEYWNSHLPKAVCKHEGITTIELWGTNR